MKPPDKSVYEKKAISRLCATQNELHHHDPRVTDEVKQAYLNNGWVVSMGWCHAPKERFSEYERYNNYDWD